MGNGVNVSKDSNRFPTKVHMSDSIYLKKPNVLKPEPKMIHSADGPLSPVLNTSKFSKELNKSTVDIKLKELLAYRIYDGLKKGRKISALMDINKFIDINENIDLLLVLMEKLKDLIDKVHLTGLISDVYYKHYENIFIKIDKCLKIKRNVLDLSSNINGKRVISIIKLLVILLNTARFFKDEGGFSEGKWWRPLKDEQFLQSLERKINNKCEAMIENYENTDEDEESFANSTSIEDKHRYTHENNSRILGIRGEEDVKKPSILKNFNNIEEKKKTSLFPNLTINSNANAVEKDMVKPESQKEVNKTQELNDKGAIICSNKEFMENLIEIKAFKENLKQIYQSNDKKIKPCKAKPLTSDDELLLFIQKYLEKTYENVVFSEI